MVWQPLDVSLAELDDGFGNIWQQNYSNSLSNQTFSTSAGDNMGSVDALEPDWLDLLFDDPTILNDRMFSDALEPHVVQAEHSYSIDNGGQTEAVVVKSEAVDKDFEIDIMGIDGSSAAVTVSHDAQPQQQQQQQLREMDTKVESMDDLPVYYQQGSRPSPGRQTLLKQYDTCPSVRLHNIDIQLDVVSVKSESSGHYDDGLPPTPPSSSGSDSAPASPSSRRSASRSLSTSQSCSFICPQVNAAGMLMLSEEEKRTLVAEGYPIPSKLPLSKADERNLKKVRRKIKNKISAQESRRKKKEYMECLEKRMEGYSRENEGLRKKVDYLESTNRSLLGQLHKLQNLVSRVPRPTAQSAPGGTYFMVLVLFFAVFLGSWSPMSWSIGSMSTSVQLSAPCDVPIPVSSSLAKPSAMQPSLDDYRVQSGRSRVMMPVHGDPEDDVAFGPLAPSGRDYFLELFSSAFLSCAASGNAAAAAVTHPDVPAIIPPVLSAAGKQAAGDGEMAPKVLAAGLMLNGSSMRVNTYAFATNFSRCDPTANCTA